VKFAYARLITEDVPALSSFYEKLLGVTPKGNDDYVELHPGGAILAIVSRGSAVFMHGGEWVAAANRSAIRMATRSTSSRRQCLRPDHPTAVPPVSDARLLAGRIGLQPVVVGSKKRVFSFDHAGTGMAPRCKPFIH